MSHETQCWSATLASHVALLRTRLLLHADLWPLIATQTGLDCRTVQGFARHYPAYRNPTIQTMRRLADALERLTDGSDDGACLP